MSIADELERVATFGGELGTFSCPPELTARILAALRHEPPAVEVEALVERAQWNAAHYAGAIKEEWQHVATALTTLDRQLTIAKGEAGEAQRMLSDLLAIVHRDGGHRQEEVGLEQAWMEAMMQVPFLLDGETDNQALRAQLAGFVNDLTGSLTNRETMLTIDHDALVRRINSARAFLTSTDAGENARDQG